MNASWGMSLGAAALLSVGCTSPARPQAVADAGATATAAETVEAPVPAVTAKKIVPVTTSSPEALAEFERGRRLVEVNRESESLEAFAKAVALDPKFAHAWAYLGYHNSGADGVAQLERAVELAKELPESETLWIDLFAAYRNGDAAGATTAVKRLLQIAPDEWRVSFELGNQAYDQRDWRLAIAAYRRSMELADLSYTCIGYNNLGYAQAMGEHYDLALAALKRCTDLQPDEPNPRDSVGEVALAAGRFEDAEASFRRGLANDPKFFYAWEGIAAVRVFQRDPQGAFDALTAARTSALIPTDRFAVDVLAAWISLALDGNAKRALPHLERMEKEARTLPEGAGLYDLADAAVQRSAILLEAGQFQEALAAADVALSRASASGLPGALAHAVERRALVRKLRALVLLGNLPRAEAVLGQLEKVGEKDVGNLEVRSGLAFAKGVIAAAKNDLPTATTELSRCVLFGLSEWTHDHTNKPEDSLCLLNLAQVQDRRGDRTGAETTRGRLRAKYTRDPVAIYVWSQVAPRPETDPVAATGAQGAQSK